MITKKKSALVVNFDYINDAQTCAATGDYRVENNVLQDVSINGQYTKDEKTYNFSASRSADGNVNIAGVPPTVLADVAEAVAELVTEIEAEVEPVNAE